MQQTAEKPETTKQEQEKVIEKIRKLMTLAKSGNTHEAETAMAMAWRLMAINNIEIQAVEKTENPLSAYHNMVGFEYGDRIPTEWHYIRTILVEFFNVNTVNCFAGRGRRDKNTVSFIGTKENIEIAQFVYNQLYTQFKRLFEEAKRNSGLKTTDKRNYYNGLFKGFYVRLNSERTKLSDELAMVIVKDPKIEQATGEFFPRLVSKAVAKYQADSAVIAKGFGDSGKLSINKAMADKANNSDGSRRLLIGQ